MVGTISINSRTIFEFSGNVLKAKSPWVFRYLSLRYKNFADIKRLKLEKYYLDVLTNSRFPCQHKNLSDAEYINIS